MILLTGTSDLLKVVTASALNIDVHVSWVDNASGVITPGRTNTLITTATTTTVTGSPGASTQRAVQLLTVRNRDVSSNVVTIKHTDGATEVELIKVTLDAGYTLKYDSDRGFSVFTPTGQIGTTIAGPGAVAGATDNAMVRWDGAGGVQVQNSLFIVDDTGHVTSFGGNLKFPSTVVVSADVNTLDDYREAPFTGALEGATTAGTQTYTNRPCSYTKVGNRVFYDISLVLSAKDAATLGNLQISGLPFASSGGVTARYSAMVGQYSAIDLNAAGGFTHMTAYIAGNGSTVVQLFECGDNVTAAALTEADFGAATIIRVSGHYPTAA